MAKAKPEYRIENWSMGNPWSDPYRAPETLTMYLMGNIEGHPNCTPGKNHVTSEVRKIDLANRRVETRNSIYTLGKISRPYLAEALKISKAEQTINVLLSVYAPEVGVLETDKERFDRLTRNMTSDDKNFLHRYFELHT